MAASSVLLGVMLGIMVLVVAEATPPGIADNPSHASCNIKKYKHCYNLVHVCPKFCPNGCTVECASCKPICTSSSDPSPSTPSTPDYSPPPSNPSAPSTPNDSPPPSSTPTTPSTPDYSPPPSNPSTPSTPDQTPPPSSTPTTPSTPDYSPPPSNPSTPSTPPPSTPTTPDHNPSPPPTTPSTPSTPNHSPPPSNPSTPSTPSSKTARCKNKNYPKCYNMEHVCPAACATGCDVDCVTCKPVCKCDKPGAVCQDPRFVGGDGITFYFHGKKDTNFCLVSDPNLHINAHFIGRTNPTMTRDFTWVQSIAILFNNHHISVGAQKTATWNDYVDRLALTFDGQPISLHPSEGATWKSNTSPRVAVTRAAETNYVVVEIEGRVRITAKVVPITEEDSRIHNYGITEEDCFAHLDLGFKFMSLSEQVSGVLGQTYRANYVSRVNIKAKMPVMGGDKDFKTTSLFVPDCSVSRFAGNDDGLFINTGESAIMELPGLSCASGINGQGVVCKR
ncbi:hypothetical protein K1719_006307 [Acacia pycnantha]|nr:hypothetical protein K1719_006307 [Acacia pycnantha]